MTNHNGVHWSGVPHPCQLIRQRFITTSIFVVRYLGYCDRLLIAFLWFVLPVTEIGPFIPFCLLPGLMSIL